jgi:hypothetical protein
MDKNVLNLKQRIVFMVLTATLPLAVMALSVGCIKKAKGLARNSDFTAN